jgi:hypothetical protein
VYPMEVLTEPATTELTIFLMVRVAFGSRFVSLNVNSACIRHHRTGTPSGTASGCPHFALANEVGSMSKIWTLPR